MSVIVDTTKAEIEMAIKYARVGANNCMIGHTWEIEELVRCRDCKHYVIFKMGSKELPFPVCEHFGMKMPSDEFYCAGGERREG